MEDKLKSHQDRLLAAAVALEEDRTKETIASRSDVVAELEQELSLLQERVAHDQQSLQVGRGVKTIGKID